MTSPSRRSRLWALALLAGGALALGPHAPRPAGPPRHAYAPQDAEGYPSEWFYLQRAFPSGTIDQTAFLAAVAQTARARNRLTTSIGPAWVKAGPDTIGGRVTALAVVPGGTTLYLGSANGGIFKSVDSGVNWTPIFEDQFAFSIGALALDPTNSNTVWCGTGEANSAIDTYDGSGIYRTTNGGTSWQYMGLMETRRIGRVAVDPSSPNRIFVAALGTQFSTGPDRGLYRSEDGGANWSKVLFVSDSTGCIDVAINPAHPETVFCATWTRVRKPTYRRAYGPECGIWRSSDHGSTWVRLSNGLPVPSDNVGRIGLAIAPSRPSMVYAQIISGAPNYNGLGMYRTTDGGATWTKRDLGGFDSAFGGFGWYFGDVAVDPTNSEKVYALGQQLVRSTDGGAHFTAIAGGANSHADQHAMWIDPTNGNHAYLGNDGGFWWSSSGGTYWMHALTLDITQFYAGAIDPSNPARLMGGSQDNSTIITTGGTVAWKTILGGDGFYCLIDPTNPAILFAESQFGSGGGGPSRSTDSGVNWTSPMGINSSDRFNWCTPFVMNPKNHNLLLVGSQRVWRSLDNGLHYTAISNDLTTNTPSVVVVYGTITTLDISAPDTSVYYAGTDDGKVWRSTNRGSSWTDISAGLPQRWVTRVTADPVDPQVVYVTHSGFQVDEHVAHVYRSSDRGTSWTPIAGNLPNIPVNDVVVDPANTQWLYAATDVGVYWTSNQGGFWSPLSTGLPFTSVFDLTLDAPSRTLVAATHGRSQWKLDVTPGAIAVDPAATRSRIALSTPAPNPSRGEASLTLDLPRAGRADVAVFDAGGRRVRTLLSGRLEAGPHSLTWDGTDETRLRVGAGVYFVRAHSGEGTANRRLVRVE